MKQKDIILVVVMVLIGAAVAVAVSRLTFSTPKNREQTAEVVDAISTDFPEPPKKYFNVKSVNPALHTENSAEADDNQ
jgi:methionine-rich copper-binding protein CopC